MFQFVGLFYIFAMLCMPVVTPPLNVLHLLACKLHFMLETKKVTYTWYDLLFCTKFLESVTSRFYQPSLLDVLFVHMNKLADQPTNWPSSWIMVYGNHCAS